MRRVGRIAFLLSLPACIGSGSDVGPHLPDGPSSALRGWVFGPNGNPVSSAFVTVVGTGKSAATDPFGRFRVNGPPAGAQAIEVDGRYAGAVGAGELGRLRVAVSVVSGKSDLGAPVVLPDLGAGASATVPLGSLLGQGDLDAPGPGGTTYTLILDPADGVNAAASVAFTDPAAHPGETSVRLTMVAFDPGGLPLPAAAPASSERTLLAFLVDPPDVVFAPGASFRVPNAFGGAPGTPVVLRHLDASSGQWVTVAGGAAVSSTGASIERFNGVAEGGLYTVVESGAGVTASFSGRVVRTVLVNGVPTDIPIPEAAVVAGDGSSARTDEGGLFLFEAGLPIPPALPTVTVVPPGHFTSARKVASAPGGPPALFGDIELRTRPGGIARGLAVFRGRPLPGAPLGLGSPGANFGTSAFTGSNGLVEVDGAPAGRYYAASAFRQGNRVLRATHPFQVGSGGGASGARVSPAKTKFKASRVKGQVAVTVVREDSLAPIEDAFVMVGLLPSPNAHLAFTDRNGRAVVSKAGNDPVTITAGFLSRTSEGALPAGSMGNPVAERRLTAYRAIAGVDASSIVIPLPAIAPSASTLAPNGRVSGTGSGLTDPSVPPPPANPSGTYAVSLRAHGIATEADLWDVFGEGTLDDAAVPAGDDDVGFPAGGGPPDFAYAVGAPAGSSTLVGVERDSTDPLSGPVTRAGFLAGIAVLPGRSTGADLALDLVPTAALAFSAAGLDPALAGSLTATFGATLPAASGPAPLVRFGDFTPAAPFDPFSGSILVPPAMGSLAGATRLLRLDAFETVAGVSRAQRAFVRENSPTSGLFPSVPEVTTPPAPYTGFDPTGAGVAWVPVASAAVQRLTLRRSEIVMETVGGVMQEVERNFEWTVFLPAVDELGGTVSSFMFPSIPLPTVVIQGMTAPQFFASSAFPSLQTHSLRLEALALTDDPLSPFPFHAFFAHADAVRFSEYAPLGLSEFAATVTE